MKTGIITRQEIRASVRFDSSFHLSESEIYENKIKSRPFVSLAEITSAIFTSGRSKRVYTDKKHGYPFLSNSDVLAAFPYDTCSYNSKKFSNDESAFLKKGMILTGRVGAIGQTALVTNTHEQRKSIGSDNIIRIVCKPQINEEVIYAYLVSKIGTTILWKHAAGGVQPYITDKMVASIPVPCFEEAFQKKVSDLIQESTKLREDAAAKIQTARDKIDLLFSHAPRCSTKNINIKSIIGSHNKRLEGSYYISEGASYQNVIEDKGNFVLLKDVTEKIFRPGIFKRQYVSNGIMFLGGADIMAANPKSDKFLPEKQVSKMPELFVQDGWILITCGGTIGNAVLVDKELAKCTISQHVMRIIPKDIPSGYLFAFLTSEIGKKSILRSQFGSVIPQMEPAHFGLIKIPLMEESDMNDISELVNSYKTNNERAKVLEAQAILLVENEIESWQK